MSTFPNDNPPFDVLIVGAGPIGLACGIEAQRRGMRYVIVEQGCLANSLFRYPAYMEFFSTPDLLEIGGVPFVSQSYKPTRLEALEYYRRVAQKYALNMRLYERVESVSGHDGEFQARTSKREYQTGKIIVAIGFFDRPRMLNVPGEELAKVVHYFGEAHPYAEQDVLVVGGGNSAVKVALDCYRHGARVTVAVRGARYDEGVKYWLLPDIENRIASNEIRACFHTAVQEIRPETVVLKPRDGAPFEIPNDFVLAMTGYQPDFDFLRRIGVEIQPDGAGAPVVNPATWESNRRGLHLAGVVVGGLETGKWFIENSREHAIAIFRHIDHGREGRVSTD